MENWSNYDDVLETNYFNSYTEQDDLAPMQQPIPELYTPAENLCGEVNHMVSESDAMQPID